MPIQETLRETFERDGFVHVAAFMPGAEMDEIEAQLGRFIREIVPGLPKSEAMHEDHERPETLKQIGDLGAHDAYFAQLLQHPRAVEIARELLGDEVVPRHAGYFSKPPGLGKATPAHQDGYFFCLVPNEAATVWIALDDIDQTNGALYYVAGSHKHGVLPHSASHVLGFSQGLNASDTTAYGPSMVCPVRRGDCLIHHSLTIHAADANRSTRPRRAIGLVYYAERARVDPELQRRYRESLSRQRQALGAV